MNFKIDGILGRSGAELAREVAAVPFEATSLVLNWNDLNNLSGDELAQVFAAIPIGVTSLHLQTNYLSTLSGAQLAKAFAAIPKNVTMLDLSWNHLGNKPSDELAKAFAAIPVSVKLLILSQNHFNKCGAKLAQALAAIPVGMEVMYGDQALQRKYDIKHLLDSYIKEREDKTDLHGITKEYFHGSFFSNFQKSFTQKRDAVKALKSALNGEKVDLSEHLSTLRNGNLGKELRAFIKSGMGDAFVGKKVSTVRDFVQALQEKNFQQAQLS